jgi:hypothetical protein
LIYRTIDKMYFAKLGSFLALAATALAGSITWVSQDNSDRTIHCTPNAGLAQLPDVQVLAGDSVMVSFPQGWIGNCYAVVAGQPNVPGMLAEVAFDSWNGLNFYDVSAIVNPADHNGVHELFPTEDPNEPLSGCAVFPCDHAYYLPDDVQTQSSQSGALTCTLGVNTASKRQASGKEYPLFPRQFVERGW